jgi:hypothetical protein
MSSQSSPEHSRQRPRDEQVPTFTQMPTFTPRRGRLPSLSFTASRTIVYDELMSPWRPRMTALGGLPNLPFVQRKSVPLGHFLAEPHAMENLTTNQFADLLAGQLLANTEDDTRAGED